MTHRAPTLLGMIPGDVAVLAVTPPGRSEPCAVLLHDGGGDRSATVDAVSRYIPEIRSQGWTLDLPALP